MLAVPSLSGFSFAYDNWGANPSTTAPGTSVTPGASNVEGSWTQVASSANLSRDCYWLKLHVTMGGVLSQVKDMLLDIGVDTAGGTSYSAVISNIVCGETAALTDRSGLSFLLPLFIPAGSSVAVRVQGSNATAGTVAVLAKFFGDPSDPENVPVGKYSETIGTITNSQGVSFTPGNAADGAWTLLGTTVNDLWWWQLCFQLSASATSDNTYIDLAYGSAGSKSVIQRAFASYSNGRGGDVARTNLCWLDCFCFVPGGSNIYVRGHCAAAPTAGYNAVAIGIGG